MYAHRTLENKDLHTICTFPQNEEELAFISPRFVYPLTSEQILQLLEDRFEPTVIIDQLTGMVVAYANLYGHDAVEKTCWLGNVIVSPEYRGQGVSPYLLDVMLEKARTIFKCQEILVACHNINSRGLAFYAKHGFAPFRIKLIKNKEQQFITIHLSKRVRGE